jgi:HEAT repeat protein
MNARTPVLPRLLLVTWILTAAALAAGAASTALNEADVRAVRAEKKVRIAVEQKYRCENAKEDDPDSLKSIELPFAATTRELLELLGRTTAEKDAAAPVTFSIAAEGEAVAGDYYGTLGGHHYTGADLSGSISVALGEHEVATRDFGKSIPIERVIRYARFTPAEAPFRQAFHGYVEELLRLAADLYGPESPGTVLQRSHNAELRVAAAHHLGAAGNRDAGPLLLAALGADDAGVRSAAAGALARLNDPRALPPLLALLKKDAPPTDDNTTAKRANNSDADENAPTETSSLDNDDHGDADYAATDSRPAVLDALVMIDAEDKHDRLIAALRDPDSVMLRAGAAEVLGRSADDKAVDALLAALGDRGFQVRIAAAKALGDLQEPAAAPALQKAAEDANEDVREAADAAIAAICKVHGPKLLEASFSEAPLLKENRLGHALTNANPVVRLQAVRELADKKTWPPLAAALKDRLAIVRLTAAKAIEGSGDEAAAALLVDSLLDKDARVAGSAARAIAAYPSRKAIPNLLVVLEKGDGEARVHAVEAFAELKDPSTVKPLIEHLDDGDYPVQQAVIVALGALKDRTAVPALLKKLDESNRVAVAAALAEIGDPAAEMPLLQAFEKSESYEREQLATSLASFHSEKMVDSLIALLARTEQEAAGKKSLKIGKKLGEATEEAMAAEEADTNLRDSTRIVLMEITQQNIDTADAWRAWWKEHRGDFAGAK